MPWRPLPRIAFAIAVYPFQPAAPADLPLELGDELYIIEEGGIEGAWLRGYLVAPPSLLSGLTSTKGQTLEARVFSGIFPRSCVEIREYIGSENDGLPPSGNADFTSSQGQTKSDANGTHAADSTQSGPSQRTPGASPAPGELPWPQPNGSSFTPNLDAKEHSPNVPRPITPTSPPPRDPTAPRPPAPVPMLKIGDETPTCADEPLVDEIASCLREWHSTNLHELLLSRQYGKLAKLTRLMNRLDMARRQLLHGVLTAQEVLELHEKVVWDMVKGNKLVNDEIIIRDPKQRGRLLTAADSIIEITRLSANMALLDQPLKTPPDSLNLHHLLVEVRSVASNLGPVIPNLLMYIYRKVPGENPVRLTESFSAEYPDEKKRNLSKTRTLFTDLTAMDTGDLSGSDAELFLVIKVQAKQDVRPNPPAALRAGPSRQSTMLLSNLQQNGMENGPKESLASKASNASRRSLLWGANRLGTGKKKFNAPPRIAEDPSSASISSEEQTLRPSTAATNSTGAAANPQSSVNPTEIKPTATALRDIGVAVVKLKDILSRNSKADETVTVWAPSETGPRGSDQDDWNAIIPDIMHSLTNKFEECLQVTQIQVHAQSFLSSNVDELIRVTPTALLNVHKTPKIGFPGAPKEPRSDIYITVTAPNLPDFVTFSHPERGVQQLQDGVNKQNLQLTMEIRKSSGQRVEHCIFPNSNSNGVTAWRTTAIRRGETWKQTIRLAIPSDEVPHCHIIMSIADAPNFPFALAWMPLWSDGAFIEDGRHLPLLYIYDKITSRQMNGRGAYLELPWDSRPSTANRNPEGQASSTATLSIETFLCSTELTQDQILLGILNWKQHSAEHLSVLLRQLSFVPDIEIVKLTVEIFTAMFGILTDKAGHEEFEDLVLANLVTVLGISRDRRFNKEPVVGKYIDNLFDFPHVAVPLLRSLQRLFARTTDYQNSRHLNSTIKCANLLMRFVVKSRKQREAQEASIGISNGNGSSETFATEVEKLFRSFTSLIRNPSPALIGSKTLLMQHHTPLLMILGTCMDHPRVWKCSYDFVDSTHNCQGKLQLHRLSMILDLAKNLEVFRTEFPEGAEALQPTYQRIAEWIAPYWGATAEVTEQYKDQVRLCVSIIIVRSDGYGNLLDDIYTKLLDSYLCLRDAGPTRKTTFSPLFPQSYPTVSKPLAYECPVDESLMEITTALTAIRGVSIDSKMYDAEHLLVTFEVLRSVIIGEAYPRSWLTLSLYHHRSALFTVQRLFLHLKEAFLPPPEQAGEFRTDLWRALFMSLLSIIGSENLALETFPEQKRRAVWKIAGDVREVGAGLLARCWNAIGWETDKEEKEQYGLDRLGGYQVQYVPNLVGPIVELCLSVHAGLRATAVQILQSMIISEWTLNGDLGVIQHEIIDNLDFLLKNKNVAENAQQKLFIIELMDLFEPLAETSDNELWEAFKDLISVVEDLLDLLIVVHNPDTSDAFRTMNTLRLMDFLREMQKEDIFISYVHQLADSEAQSRCFKEAGLALRLHADLYEWNTNKIAEELKSPAFPTQSQFERKEAIYFDMIKHFEEGAAYSSVLECYRELADHYEHTSFDFAKLARAQRSMAKVYELIARGEGQSPRYFRVVYKGLSFPPSLRDKQFVFEGNGAERLVTFTDRLQREHPQAQLATSTDNVEGEGQFLLVTAVTPYRDLKHPLYQRTKVGFATKEYVLSASPVNFAVTTKRHSPKTGVRDQWVEKTVYTTAEVFPTILRRSEIIAEEVLPLSPDQTAIERTVRKTSELWTLEKRVREGDDMSNWSLMEAVKTSVDASSSTSVAQYRDMLPKKDTDEVRHQPDDPMKTGLQIALLDFTSTLRHCLNTFSKSMPSQDFQKLQNQLQATFAPELAALQPTQDPEANLPLFADADFQMIPPSPQIPGFSVESSQPEAQDVLPETASRPKPVLNSEARALSRANRLSALLKRKPSTANSNDTAPSGGLSQSNGFGFGKGKATLIGTSSGSAVNEAHNGRNADILSSQSSQQASATRVQAALSAARRQNSGTGDMGGPVYTAITSAKDTIRNRDGRPTTSHSNGTVTTTGRRIAALRKRLSARKLGIGSDGDGSVQRWGDGDAIGVRVEVRQ